MNKLNKEIAKIEKEIERWRELHKKNGWDERDSYKLTELKSKLTGLKLGAELTAQEIFDDIEKLGQGEEGMICGCEKTCNCWEELKKKWKVK